jgi:hypothetical protein
MIISTSPRLPPEAFPTGSHDFNVEIREMGLDLYAELDYRMARILGNELETDAGLDFDFDTTTGELTIDVTFDADDIRYAITYNEIAPAYTGQLEDAFGSLFETLLTPLLGDGVRRSRASGGLLRALRAGRHRRVREQRGLRREWELRRRVQHQQRPRTAPPPSAGAGRAPPASPQVSRRAVLVSGW